MGGREEGIRRRRRRRRTGGGRAREREMDRMTVKVELNGASECDGREERERKKGGKDRREQVRAKKKKKMWQNSLAATVCMHALIAAERDCLWKGEGTERAESKQGMPDGGESVDGQLTPTVHCVTSMI